jgi:hypothetical protein
LDFYLFQPNAESGEILVLLRFLLMMYVTCHYLMESHAIERR